jgi:hypothetical protein
LADAAARSHRARCSPYRTLTALRPSDDYDVMAGQRGGGGELARRRLMLIWYSVPGY